MTNARTIALALLGAALAGCGGAQTTSPEVESASEQAGVAADEAPASTPCCAVLADRPELCTAVGPEVGVPNERRFTRGVTGGQPTAAHLDAAVEANIQTVISLRREDEAGVAESSEAVRARGMHLVSIPVAGAGGLTEANARAVGEALASSEGPALLHCGSGNRAAAMIALNEFYAHGAAPLDALRCGEALGLTSLRDAVVQAMGVACDSDSPPSGCP
ncbi:MAG: sulfur transferase domain-containing protein [Myxococcota bacterium]